MIPRIHALQQARMRHITIRDVIFEVLCTAHFLEEFFVVSAMRTSLNLSSIMLPCGICIDLLDKIQRCLHKSRWHTQWEGRPRIRSKNVNYKTTITFMKNLCQFVWMTNAFSKVKPEDARDAIKELQHWIRASSTGKCQSFLDDWDWDDGIAYAESILKFLQNTCKIHAEKSNLL